MGAKKKKNKIFVNVPEELREEPDYLLYYYLSHPYGDDGDSFSRACTSKQQRTRRNVGPTSDGTSTSRQPRRRSRPPHSNVEPPTPDLTADAGTGAASRLVARGYGGRVGALDRTRSQLAGLLDLLRLRRVCRRLGMCWDQFLDRNQISMPLTSKMYKYIQTCTEKGK